MLRVHRSTYYKHFYSEPAPRSVENERIKKIILFIYAEYDKRLGAYKIAVVLERDYGIKISVGRVYRLMKTLNLPKMSTRKPRYRGFSDSPDCNNKLEQDFKQKAPNLVWVSDITYIRVSGYWCYLCVILDLYSRKVIAWDISTSATADFVIKVFRKAYALRGEPQGLMFHSDRGTQYTSFAFRQLLDSLNVVQSFSKKGYPYDNAVMECFFKFLKQEETNRRTYHNQDELRKSLFKYIDGLYNSRRPHSTLGYLTPNQMEDQYFGRA